MVAHRRPARRYARYGGVCVERLAPLQTTVGGHDGRQRRQRAARRQMEFWKSTSAVHRFCLTASFVKVGQIFKSTVAIGPVARPSPPSVGRRSSPQRRRPASTGRPRSPAPVSEDRGQPFCPSGWPCSPPGSPQRPCSPQFARCTSHVTADSPVTTTVRHHKRGKHPKHRPNGDYLRRCCDQRKSGQNVAMYHFGNIRTRSHSAVGRITGIGEIVRSPAAIGFGHRRRLRPLRDRGLPGHCMGTVASAE